MRQLTTIGVRPKQGSPASKLRCPAFSRPVSSPISPISGRTGEPRQHLMRVLARQDLGRRHQRRSRAALDCDQHRGERDDGLAAADVATPVLSRIIRCEAFMSPAILPTPGGAALQREGKAETGLGLCLQFAGSGEDPAGAAAPAGADQRHGELRRKDLVTGETPRAGVAGARSPRSGAHRGDRRLPARPAAPRASAGSSHSESSGARSSAAFTARAAIRDERPAVNG